VIIVTLLLSKHIKTRLGICL